MLGTWRTMPGMSFATILGHLTTGERGGDTAFSTPLPARRASAANFEDAEPEKPSLTSLPFPQVVDSNRRKRTRSEIDDDDDDDPQAPHIRKKALFLRALTHVENCAFKKCPVAWQDLPQDWILFEGTVLHLCEDTKE